VLFSNYLEPGTATIQLPANSDRHISQIYQTIQNYLDPALSGAVIVSLYRGVARRLSNQNHLLISRLLSEVGATDVSFEKDLTLSRSFFNQLFFCRRTLLL
jgi:hypothetical protein